jgi:hypothetical protein
MGYNTQTVSEKQTEVEKYENNKIFYGGIDVYGIILARIDSSSTRCLLKKSQMREYVRIAKEGKT